MSAPSAPEGIESHHIHRAEGSSIQRWPFGSAALGVLLALSYFGVYGDDQTLSDSGENVQFVIQGPAVIRNGEFFEMMLQVEARRDIQNLVVLVEPGLWRDMTVNTLLPDPSEQGFANGAFSFDFGMLDGGKSLLVKIDGQVNPSHGPSANEGDVSIADDRTTLASVNFKIEVLP
jgi:hypothetical protein